VRMTETAPSRSAMHSVQGRRWHVGCCAHLPSRRSHF
jgi:hypothetical protein